MAKKEYESATVQQLLARLVELLEGGTSDEGKPPADGDAPLGPVKPKPIYNSLYVAKPEGLYFLIPSPDPDGEPRRIACSEVGVNAICAYLKDMTFDLENEYKGRPSPKIYFHFSAKKPPGDVLDWDLKAPYTEPWNFTIRTSIAIPEVGGIASTLTRLMIFNLGRVVKNAGVGYLKENPVIMSVRVGDEDAVLLDLRMYDRASGRWRSIDDIAGSKADFDKFRALKGEDPVWYEKAIQIGALLRGETDTYGGSPAAQQPEPRPVPEGVQ